MILCVKYLALSIICSDIIRAGRAISTHLPHFKSNTPYKYLQKWIWNRLNDVPLQLIDLRDTRTNAALAVDKLWNEVIEAEENRLIMQEELRLILPDTEVEFDDAQHEQEWLLQKDVLNQVELEFESARAAHDTENKRYTKLKADVNKLEKKKEFRKQSQDLWMQVERILRKDFNIYPSTYHGGDLEGNECWHLLRLAIPALDAVKALLIAHFDGLPEEDKKRRADRQEIDIFVGFFQQLFQYMDVLSHYAYQLMGAMSDEDLDAVTQCVYNGAHLWHNLMPTVPMKVHGWQHLLEDFKRLCGQKSHNKHGIERAHQAGKGHAIRLKCIRDFETKKNPTTECQCQMLQCGCNAHRYRSKEKEKKNYQYKAAD